MKKHMKIIPVDPFNLPPRSHWNIEVNIPRATLPKFCEGMHILINKRRGTCFYYPDIKSEKTTFRYEWDIPFQDKEFGIRLGIQFDVDEEDLRDINVYAAYGVDHESHENPPSFSKDDINIFHNLFIDILNKSFEVAIVHRYNTYHIIFHTEMPTLQRIDKHLNLTDYGITIFPTVIIKKSLKRVSAIVFSVNSRSLEYAKSDALRKFMIYNALITLASNLHFNLVRLEWPRNRKSIEYVESLNPYPNMADVYPFKRWMECHDNVFTKYPCLAEHILELYYNLKEEDRKFLLDSLMAYYSGEGIKHDQPTLATVCYISSLNIFSNSKACKGEVLCSKCGILKAGHFLEGDKISIQKSIAKLFNINSRSKAYKELGDLFSNIYSKHRSAFVHGAVLRHGEFFSNYSLPDSIPTQNMAYGERMLYKLDLLSFKPVVRRALLEFMAQKSGIRLNYELLDLNDFKIRKYSTFEIITVATSKYISKLKIRPQTSEN